MELGWTCHPTGRQPSILESIVVEPRSEEAPLVPQMWHGGCRVRSGEKWTLQFFKELPYSTPTPVTLSTV